MILKTMDGVSFEITDEEAQKILKAKADDNMRDIFIRGCTIPKSAVALYTNEFWEAKEGIGVLHDGTRVIKKFGQWVNARDPDVRLDWHHYPELLTDEILTPSQYNALKPLLLEASDSDAQLEIYNKAITDRLTQLAAK